MNQKLNILLLSPFLWNDQTFNINQCTSRYQLYLFMVYDHLKNNYNITVMKSFKTVLNKNNEYDHAIILNGTIYSKLNKNYISLLRKSVKGNINHITYTNTQFVGEDILFYLSTVKCVHNRLSSKHIGWIYNKYLENADKPENILNILMDSNKDINTQNEINKFITNNTVHKVNLNYTFKFKYLPEIYDEYKKTHVYIITQKCNKYIELAEIAMSNVIIVACPNCVHPKIIKEFDIIEFNTKSQFPWTIILAKMNNIDFKTNYLNNKLTFQQTIDNIMELTINYVNDHEKMKNEKSTENDNENYIETIKTIALKRLNAFNTKNKINPINNINVSDVIKKRSKVYVHK